MVNTVIEISLILGVVLGMVAYVGPNIAQPLLNETKCSIQNLEVFQISDTQYLMEMELLNNGDTLITNYDIRSSGWTISRDVIISSGNFTTNEFTVYSIDEGFLEVLVTTAHDSAICVTTVNQ